jgi:hypothetical protein
MKYLELHLEPEQVRVSIQQDDDNDGGGET